ncbi:beta strand repeat-containing protein [Undibacterium sp. RuTC16W]|uniref:beta strand repeat-containing protein n=1 Tax=Undibacterium sp. RuTC16W TaxID=3413048 RepID=UPI003BEF72BA
MTSHFSNMSAGRWMQYWIMILLGVLSSACGGGAGSVGIASGKALFSSAPSAITINIESVSYSIGGGTAPYKASSSNPSVTTAEVKGSTLAINGIAAGSAQITITDAVGATIAIATTVGSGSTSTALFTTAPGITTVNIGSSTTFTIAGGKPAYVVSSNNAAVASVGINGATYIISGKAAGTAQILIFDSTGTSISITVNVTSGGVIAPLYTTAPGAISMAANATDTFSIGGGVAPYTSTTSNASVGSSTISGNSISVHAVAAGSGQILIFDATGASVSINITVTQTGNLQLDVQPGAATGNVGDALQFVVSGGTPPYAITVNNPSIASASPSSVSASNGTFSTSLINAGSTAVTIVDATGVTKSVALTVSQLAASLRFSPGTLLIGEDNIADIILNVYGGTGPYRAFTSDQTLSSVTVSGATVKISLGSSLNRCINPVDSSGVRIPNGTFDVTITVLDSLGASATSIMTIKDNGVGNGTVTTQPAPFSGICN